jgi:leucyl-tRNA synthetase
MLSDSPPERDVLWTEAGVDGSWRFIQRVWRLMNEASELMVKRNTKKPAEISGPALALRRAAHRALNNVAKDIEGLRFNRAIAAIYDFTNSLNTAIQDSGAAKSPGFSWVLREACEFMAQAINPIMPHLGEECWTLLGYNTLVANAPWPEVEAGLLVDGTVTIAVQVNGKRRDEMTIARDAASEDVQAAALQLESVIRAIEGRAVKKVIVVPQRIVNVVA